MGGKAKQAQRVKGNLKPANSEKAFYSLHQQQQPDSNLFSLDSGLGFSSSFVEDVLEIDFSSADQSFQLVLKKCLKKDPTTKIKALKELIDLINQSELDIVLTALPFFPKIYNQLSTDIDARVRETCQLSLNAIVGKVGKHLATILKYIFGSWICSMYDTNPTAASIATNCFDKAFPSHKVSDVFVHCEPELLEFFNKNLNVHTNQTICNPKAYTEEEREAKYQRLLISSFRGYALYLQKISPQRLEEVSQEKNRLIVENDRFWHHHKSKIPQIRSSFFEAVANVLNQGAFLVKNVEQKLTSRIFKSIDETEPEVLTHIWSCVVLTQQKIENWVDFVNFEKAFLPKLSKILRSASYPNLIYPNLLPLISKIDKAITETEELNKFYSKFFDDIKHGMTNVQLGKSELSAVSSAYFEVLQYVIIKLANNPESEDFICNLMDDHVIAVIYWCIHAETSFGRAIFPQIRNFAQYFSKSQTNYGKMLERFWSELYLVLNSSIVTPSTNTKNIAANHVELIKQLRTVKKVAGKIRFQDQVDSVTPDNSNSDESSENEFSDHLVNFACKLCLTYIDRIHTTQESAFIENLEIFIKEYQSANFLKKLAGWNDPNETKLSTLAKTFMEWLMIEDLSCELIVEIILVLYKHLEPSDKIELSDIMKIPSAKMWLIERTLSHPFCNDPRIVSFLKGREVADFMIECAEFVIKNPSNADKLSILQKSFFKNDEGIFLITSETCTKIVEIISKPLNDDTLKNQMDQCASFLAQIFPVICNDSQFDSVKMTIFSTLFELSVMRDISDDLSEDTLWEVSTSWEDALSSCEVEMNDEILENCAKIIHKKLNSILLVISSTQSLEKFAKIITKLINCITDQESQDNKLTTIEKVMKKVLLYDEESANYVENICTTIQLMKGKFLAKNIENVPEKSFYLMMNTHLRCVLINLEVFIELCCSKINQDQDDDEDYDESQNSITEWSDYIIEFFMRICYTDGIMNILLSELNKLQHEDWIIYLQERLTFALKSLPENIFGIVRENLFKSAATKGGLWVECLRKLLDTKHYNNNMELLQKDIDGIIQRQNSQISDVNCVQLFVTLIEKKTLPISMINSSDLMVKISFARSLLRNYLEVDNFNQYGDRKVVGHSLILLNEIIQKQNSERFLLYNRDISNESELEILMASEVAQFLSDLLTFIPCELDNLTWDFIRLALSSWVLSVSKSIENLKDNKVKIFIASIFNLNSSLYRFMRSERTKSSTPLLKDVIDEWDKVFAKDVNVILTKSFVNIIKKIDYESKHQESFSDVICSYVGSIDLTYCMINKKIDNHFSLEDLIKFTLENISSKSKITCVAVSTIIKNLTAGLIRIDQEVLLQRNSEDSTGKNDSDNMENNEWHILDTFRSTLETYQVVLSDFIEDFHFKQNDLDNLANIPENIAFSWLLLWNCILNFCSKAPAEFRSIYARWITAHNYQDVFLVSLFKLMPVEMMRNPEVTGHFNLTAFNPDDIENSTVTNEKFAAYLYAESLRTVPVIVRRWWHGSSTRQAQIVERITQNNFSPVLSQQDLTILTKREKDGKDNMHIKVLMQSREIFASYSLEDAKMELSIVLPANYPLGAIKIESLKHIAGRFEAREIVKQLSIYLTHQNGRLYDGILLWKRNLDRKYEGVEECFVCYSVINSETFQLPRLTCKTCKKKFHSNCLYKWFTSSNKSTCPLCRNIF